MLKRAIARSVSLGAMRPSQKPNLCLDSLHRVDVLIVNPRCVAPTGPQPTMRTS
ncbi:MAG: hypothetical protein AAGA81_03625 [Acidobacteriota bacterium]